MNSTSAPDPQAEDTAALWAARLEGAVLSTADRAALDAWLAHHPLHRTLLSEYCQFSADLEEQLPLLVAAGAATLPAAPAAPRARRRPWRGGSWLFAASLVAAACVTVVLWPARSRLEPVNVATPVALRDALTLADGSRVELNARTSLVVEQAEGERRVRLAAGEAFFSVSKDPARPFIVETPAGSVRVTGTRFNVRSETNAPLEVTVVEGSVQVRPGEGQTSVDAAPVSLEAGGRFTAGPEGPQVRTVSTDELENVLAWREGRIVFDGVPLAEALARFAHHHGRALNASSRAAGLQLGGRFSLDDLDGFLAALEDVLPVTVSRDLNGALRVRHRSEE